MHDVVTVKNPIRDDDNEASARVVLTFTRAACRRVDDQVRDGQAMFYITKLNMNANASRPQARSSVGSTFENHVDCERTKNGGVVICVIAAATAKRTRQSSPCRKGNDAVTCAYTLYISVMHATGKRKKISQTGSGDRGRGGDEKRSTITYGCNLYVLI